MSRLATTRNSSESAIRCIDQFLLQAIGHGSLKKFSASSSCPCRTWWYPSLAAIVCRVPTLRLVVLGDSCHFSDEVPRTRAMDSGQFEFGASLCPPLRVHLSSGSTTPHNYFTRSALGRVSITARPGHFFG